MNNDVRSIQQGRKRSAPAVLEIHEAIRVEGEHELSRPVSALFLSALAAGLSMGFSFLAEAALSQALPSAQWTPLVSKLGYCVGFLIVILGRQQLFTENTLTPILALFTNPSKKCFGLLLRLWAVVLGANMLGALLFALFIAKTPVFAGPTTSAFTEIGMHLFEIGGTTTFLRGILGGWLVALMVWLLPFAETARPWIIIIITYLIGIGHLSHIVAGSVETFYVFCIGSVTLTELMGQFWLPALFGNVIGGVGFVATLHQAQVYFGQEAHGWRESEDTEEATSTSLRNPFVYCPESRDPWNISDHTQITEE